jgi:hypothetical protein
MFFWSILVRWTETQFFDVTGTKVQEFFSLLFTVTATNGFTPLAPTKAKVV